MGQTARKRADRIEYPDHEYANGHVLYQAYLDSKPPTVRAAEKMRPIGEVACDRIRELGYDLGAEREWARWMADVSEKLGINYSTARAIFNGDQNSVSSVTVWRMHLKTGIPVEAIYGLDG